VDSLALANAQMNLQKAYNHFFSIPKKFGFPKFKSKHKTQKAYTNNNQKGSVKIENGYIQLPKVGCVKLKQHRNIPDDCKSKSVTISQNASGKYFASVFFEYNEEIIKKEPENFIDLDFSMYEYMLTATEIVQSFRDITDFLKRN